jgi:hypothetical protein
VGEGVHGRIVGLALVARSSPGGKVQGALSGGWIPSPASCRGA